MLLLDPALVDLRRRYCVTSLAPLAERLSGGLEPLIARGSVYVPRAKALLSRAGGRCDVDGSTLEFDPYSPHAHRCPHCKREFDGDMHHRWWVLPYQLWLAERGVHAALLHLLRHDPRHLQLARDIVGRYAELYEQYPNCDNVLGPTRPFFSTYLESIWLLQLCMIGDFVEIAGDRATADLIRERIVRPSAAIVAQFDEGLSNRQVWNNAALLAAALLLDDRPAAERVIRGPSGVESHLTSGLLRDGTWYEGENYHLFAHRGLWYGVTMAEIAGFELPTELRARFDEGFAAPFVSAMPDLTLPSRKDSQYAISLRQARVAESCELGLARLTDQRLLGALGRLYADDLPPGDTGQATSTADIERNVPASRLARADLGWRSLLHALGELPALHGTSPRSALLDGQGLAIFRRDTGRTYVAVDWGQSGGEHGHPDRLNLLFARDGDRWLEDLGTGSYVDTSLHWYRSTLAHNAPLLDGHSQRRADGMLLAWDERPAESIGWVMARAREIAPSVRVDRTLVVAGCYFMDELRWDSDRSRRLELPIHFTGELRGVMLKNGGHLDGGDLLEDGFDAVWDVSCGDAEPKTITELVGAHDGQRPTGVRAWIISDVPARWFRAVALGQPSGSTRPFFLLRCEAQQGVIRAVWTWSPLVEAVAFNRDGVEVTFNGERETHRRSRSGWRIERVTSAGLHRIDLAGWQPGEPSQAGTSSRHGIEVTQTPVEHAPVVVRRSVNRDVSLEWFADRLDADRARVATWELGADHYRRSEETWIDAGGPTARIAASSIDRLLIVDVQVRTATPVFVPAGVTNPFDNEHPDINGHGIQLYVRTASDGGAWMIVPETGSGVARVRPLPGWGALALREARWRRTREGFDAQVVVELPERSVSGQYPLFLDVLVNETVPGRERRRGQLVLSGAHGEFVYLHGDRHDPGRLFPLVLTD